MNRFRSAIADYAFEGPDLVISPADRSTRRTPKSFNTALDRTRQEFRDECNPNNVIRRFALTGDLGRLNPRTGKFLDVSETPDLLGCLEQVSAALDLFRALPEDLRALVNDSPQQLVALADHQAAWKAWKAQNAPPAPPSPPASPPTPEGGLGA